MIDTSALAVKVWLQIARHRPAPNDLPFFIVANRTTKAARRTPIAASPIDVATRTGYTGNDALSTNTKLPHADAHTTV